MEDASEGVYDSGDQWPYWRFYDKCFQVNTMVIDGCGRHRTVGCAFGGAPKLTVPVRGRERGAFTAPRPGTGALAAVDMTAASYRQRMHAVLGVIASVHAT